MNETDDQRCMRIAEGIDRAEQEGKGGRLIEDMIWLFDRAAGRNTAIREAVAAENMGCAEIARGLWQWGAHDSEKVAQAIEARVAPKESKQ